MAANPNLTIADLRSLFDEWHQPTLEPEGVTYKSDVVAGVESIWALPVGADSSKVILYTQGAASLWDQPLATASLQDILPSN